MKKFIGIIIATIGVWGYIVHCHEPMYPDNMNEITIHMWGYLFLLLASLPLLAD